MTANTDILKQVIEARLAKLGFELFDLKFFRAGRGTILRIFIDKENGVTIGDCEQVSHEMSILMEVENLINHSYTLEVSSPGADRPLKKQKDFLRLKGKEIKLNYITENDKKRSVSGYINNCKDNILTLDTKKEMLSIPLSKVINGKQKLSLKS